MTEQKQRVEEIVAGFGGMLAGLRVRDPERLHGGGISVAVEAFDYPQLRLLNEITHHRFEDVEIILGHDFEPLDTFECMVRKVHFILS